MWVQAASQKAVGMASIGVCSESSLWGQGGLNANISFVISELVDGPSENLCE